MSKLGFLEIWGFDPGADSVGSGPNLMQSYGIDVSGAPVRTRIVTLRQTGALSSELCPETKKHSGWN